jgi:protocatechuate 3,4-dioxygenase, alpha subunit
MRAPTPSQTVGPFFRFGMAWASRREVVPPESSGAIHLNGRVLDGDGEPVPDAVVEIFGADLAGGFPPGWDGFGRCLTDTKGRYGFVTVKPGSVDGYQAPHLDVSVFARGLLQRLVTRIYFPGEEEANAADPLLSNIGDRQRAATLVAVPSEGELVFDVRLQGERETVFLAW